MAFSGCSRSAPEPEPSRERPALVDAEPSLRWTAPASWSLEKAADSGRYRAKYTVPAQGNSEHPAEVLVTSLGVGAAEGLDAPLQELEADFGGPGAATPVRRTRRAGRFELRELEVAGTYKFPMGPRLRNRPVAQVLKEGWRAIAVAVVAPDGERWFFRIVGPDDAVQAARSSFQAMIDGLELPAPGH